TLTVSAESPVVATQTNFKAQVLPREILDSVPTAHTIQSVGQLVVGVQMDVPDVGGSRAMQQTYFIVHGAGTAQTSVLMDGMIINGLQNDGAVQSYMNDAGAEQMVYQTGGGTADSPSGGMKLNVSPNEGGNEMHGSIFAGFEASGLQRNNQSPFLAKNAVNDQSINSVLLRLTWQVSPRNKLSAYMDRLFKTRDHDVTSGDDPATAGTYWNSPIYETSTIKWTSTVNNRLLIEGGYSSNIERYNQLYEPGVRKPYGSPEWYAGALRQDTILGTR